MLEKIRRVLIPCFIVSLIASYGYGMDMAPQSGEEQEPKHSTPQKKQGRKRSKSLTCTEPKEKKMPPLSLLRSQVVPETSSLNEEAPLDYNYLFIVYDYSDEFINHLKYYGNATNFKPFYFKLQKPIESSEIQQWHTEYNKRCKEYKQARKEYMTARKNLERSQSASDLQVFKAKKEAFQPILRKALCRHGTEKTIRTVQKIEEEIVKKIKNALISNQLYRDYIGEKADPQKTSISKVRRITLRKQLEQELCNNGALTMVKRTAEIWEELDIWGEEHKALLLQPSVDNQVLIMTDPALIDADLYDCLFSEANKDLVDDIKSLEALIYGTPGKSPSPKPAERLFVLKPSEVRLGIQRSSKSIKHLKKENPILKRVILSYTQDYLERVQGWSLEDWSEYNNPETIPTVKRSIKQNIEAAYPYGTYDVQFIGKDPTPECLKIKPRTIALYFKNKDIFFKIGNREEKFNPFHWKKFSAFKEKKLTTNLSETLNEAVKEEWSQMLEVQWALINFFSFCGYLPDDFSLEELSRVKKERKKCLDILFNRSGWERKGVIWKKSLDPAVDFVLVEHDDPTATPLSTVPPCPLKHGDKFSEIWKPFSISNKVFVILSKLDPKKGEKPVNLDDLKLTDEILKDGLQITATDIAQHRLRMLCVLQTPLLTTKKKYINFNDFPRYDTRDVKKYNTLQAKLKKLSIKNRKLQTDLDKLYSKWSYIPTCRSFFASEDIYGDQIPILEIDLSHSQLSDNSFFTDDQASAPEKMHPNKPQGMLVDYKKRVDLSHNALRGYKHPTLSTELEELDLNSNALESLKIVETLSNLKVLNLYSNSTKNKAFSSLSNCTSLTSLNLAYNVKLQNISALTGLTCLSDLNLSGNDNLFNSAQTAQTFNSLATLPSLRILTLRENGISGEWTQVFPTTLTQLQVLDMRENNKLKWDLQDIDFNKEFKNFFPALKCLKTDIGEFTWL